MARRMKQLAESEYSKLKVMENEVEGLAVRVEARLEFMDRLHWLALELEEMYQVAIEKRDNAH